MEITLDRCSLIGMSADDKDGTEVSLDFSCSVFFQVSRHETSRVVSLISIQQGDLDDAICTQGMSHVFPWNCTLNFKIFRD